MLSNSALINTVAVCTLYIVFATALNFLKGSLYCSYLDFNLFKIIQNRKCLDVELSNCIVVQIFVHFFPSESLSMQTFFVICDSTKSNIQSPALRRVVGTSMGEVVLKRQNF